MNAKISYEDIIDACSDQAISLAIIDIDLMLKGLKKMDTRLSNIIKKILAREQIEILNGIVRKRAKGGGRSRKTLLQTDNIPLL